MKVFATVCLLGLLVAAFSVVAVIAQPEGEKSADDGASRQLLVVVRELLDGRDVACERIVRPLLGLDEHAAVDEDQLIRLLLGLEADAEIDPDHLARLLGIDDGETVNCEWTFRMLLGLEEGEQIDNEQLVRLLLGIDDSEDIGPEEVLMLLERNVSLE